MAGNCMHCNKIIKSGRSDKKFCDEACKNAFYNLIKIQEHAEIKRVDLILKKNRRILKKLFNPLLAETVVSGESLLKARFEFNFHTHHVITKTFSNEFIFCYDYGYRELTDGKYKIIRDFKSTASKNN